MASPPDPMPVSSTENTTLLIISIFPRGSGGRRGRARGMPVGKPERKTVAKGGPLGETKRAPRGVLERCPNWKVCFRG